MYCKRKEISSEQNLAKAAQHSPDSRWTHTHVDVNQQAPTQGQGLAGLPHGCLPAMKRCWYTPNRAQWRKRYGMGWLGESNSTFISPGNEASQAFLVFLSSDLTILMLWWILGHNPRVAVGSWEREVLLFRLAAHTLGCSLSSDMPFQENLYDCTWRLASPSCHNAKW